jgi:hypothetical protein
MKTTLLKFTLAAMLGLAPANIPAETIGAPLMARSSGDWVLGQIYILNNGFTTAGVLTSWSIFNSNPGDAGKALTPFLAQKVGSDYILLGIGASRTNNSSGIQSFSFDLTSGSDVVAPGYLFGWKDGTDADAFQSGVIQFDFVGFPAAGTQQWFFSGNAGVGFSGNLTPGNNLGAGVSLGSDVNQLDRDYSVQATVTVPEPSALALGILAAAGFLARARRAQRGI